MKRIALTLAIALGIAFGASAQNRGLLDLGPESGNSNDAYGPTRGSAFLLPQNHGTGEDQNGSPLGGGALLLIGFGAAYALKKRQK